MPGVGQSRIRLSPRRRRLFVAVLAVFVAALLGLAGELLLRIVWLPGHPYSLFVGVGLWREPEPGCWEPVPCYTSTLDVPVPRADGSSSAGFGPGPTRSVVVRTDSLGCRGPELAPRQPRELRLLFAGDSVVYGHFVAEGEGFAAITGELVASQLHRPVSVCNAGVPGYGFAAARRRAGRLLPQVAPDAVVVGLCMANDFIDDVEQSCAVVIANRLFTGLVAKSIRDSWRARLASHSRLWLFAERLLAPQWPAVAMVQPPILTPSEVALVSGLPDVEHATGGLFLDAVDVAHEWPGDPPVIPRLLARFRAELEALVAAVGDRALLLVVEPSRYEIDPVDRAACMQRLGFAADRYVAGLAQQRVLAICAELGVVAVDLTPALTGGEPLSTLYMDGDRTHFTVKGNAVIAAAIAPHVAAALRDR